MTTAIQSSSCAQSLHVSQFLVDVPSERILARVCWHRIDTLTCCKLLKSCTLVCGTRGSYDRPYRPCRADGSVPAFMVSELLFCNLHEVLQDVCRRQLQRQVRQLHCHVQHHTAHVCTTNSVKRTQHADVMTCLSCQTAVVQRSNTACTPRPVGRYSVHTL